MPAGDEASPQTFLSMYNGKEKSKLEEEQGLGCCMPSSFLANNSFCYNKASTTNALTLSMNPTPRTSPLIFNKLPASDPGHSPGLLVQLQCSKMSPEFSPYCSPWSSPESSPESSFYIPCFSGCLQRANGNAAATRDQTQAIKPADWSVWSRDRFCKLQAT